MTHPTHLHPYFHEALKTPQAPLRPCAAPAVDRYFADPRCLYEREARLLQDEHNVNLHSAGEGDDFLDGEGEDQYEGLTIISDAEFIERYVD